MLRQVEPGRKHGDGEAFLSIEAFHTHQPVEATQQEGSDGIPAAIGTRHGLNLARTEPSSAVAATARSAGGG